MERDFLSPVDSKAASALNSLKQGEALSEAQRGAWSMFIASLICRMPEDVRLIKQMLAELGRGTAPSLRRFYDASIPFAFYLCWLSSDFINNQLPSTGHVVAAAAYIYLGFVGLWAYRILFSYTKWAFPLVEITDQSTRPALHRKVCWAIICVVSGKVFWDVADPILSIRGMLAF
ncbi:hypothetical protein [Agrobacterium bohemicum]|nr:hypothetical protein [Agrobacterium bohemicum]